MVNKFTSNSLSNLSVTISKWSKPRNPHLNPKPKAEDDSGSKEKLASFNCNLAKPSFNFWNSELSTGNKPSNSVELPLLGRIAAGTPIEALSDPTSYMSVPDALVSGGEHFALEIVGDSMIEAGIHEGDTVIIKRTDNANSGDIVVALVEEHEATLKTLRKEPGRIALEAANPAYETRYFETDKVRIQGRLTGLIRRY